jgi:hypothetical protein
VRAPTLSSTSGFTSSLSLRGVICTGIAANATLR